MGIQIEISNSKISDNAKLMENVNIRGKSDAQIKVNGLEMEGNASVLENIEFSEVVDDLKTQVQYMDKNTKEYRELQCILNTDISKRDELKKKMTTHLLEFSTGVLARIITKLITNM